jgi:hypothetical protein
VRFKAIDDPMSNEAIARSFSWSLGGVLVAILLLNAFDVIVTYQPKSVVKTSWINLIPKP